MEARKEQRTVTKWLTPLTDLVSVLAPIPFQALKKGASSHTFYHASIGGLDEMKCCQTSQFAARASIGNTSSGLEYKPVA